MKRFVDIIGSHVRNIDVLYYKNKSVFNIPLYDDVIYKYTHIRIDDNELIVTTSRVPILPHPANFSCDNHSTMKDLLGENENNLK